VVTDAVLALDLSSSGVRARAHSRALTVVAERSVDIATRVGADGASCHDLVAIMAAVREVVRPLAADPRLRIVALVASGTASSLAVARLGDGAPEPLSEVLLWSDSRAMSHYPELADDLAAAYGRTLCPPDVSYWPAKVRYLADRDGLAGGVLAGGVLAGAKDLVFAWLTGLLWTDPMSAASTGMFDSAGWRWDAPLLDRVGITAGRLPELHEAVESAPLIPAAARDLGLPAGLPVTLGGMDGPLTQLGAAGTRERTATCTIGTSIAVRTGSARRRADPARRTWCYPVTRGFWVIGGAGSNGGNLLTWLRDQVGLAPTAQQLADLAFSVPSDPDLTFVPYLHGERAPLWRSDLRAAFIGLAAHHSSADMTRAVLDGLAASVLELADAVESVAGAPERVVFTGGFIRAARWVQLMTDALGVPTAVPVPEEATSVGAGMLAWSAVEDLPVAEVFTPRLEPVADPDPRVHERLRSSAARLAELRRVLWPQFGRPRLTLKLLGIYVSCMCTSAATRRNEPRAIAS
jgi:gluconokinase